MSYSSKEEMMGSLRAPPQTPQLGRGGHLVEPTRQVLQSEVRRDINRAASRAWPYINRTVDIFVKRLDNLLRQASASPIDLHQVAVLSMQKNMLLDFKATALHDSRQHMPATPEEESTGDLQGIPDHELQEIHRAGGEVITPLGVRKTAL